MSTSLVPDYHPLSYGTSSSAAVVILQVPGVPVRVLPLKNTGDFRTKIILLHTFAVPFNSGVSIQRRYKSCVDDLI